MNCLYPAVQVQLQRGMYMYRCAHCTHDKDCMHTTVDGADQTAFGLPHFNQDDKCTSEGLKYKVSITHQITGLYCHVIVCIYKQHFPCYNCYFCSLFLSQTRLYGAITHGVETNAFMFSGYMPGGTNVTVEIFHR